MIQLGEIQTLQIVKKVDFGVYLGESTKTEERTDAPAESKSDAGKRTDGRLGTQENVLLPGSRCLRARRLARRLRSSCTAIPRID